MAFLKANEAPISPPSQPTIDPVKVSEDIAKEVVIPVAIPQGPEPSKDPLPKLFQEEEPESEEPLKSSEVDPGDIEIGEEVSPGAEHFEKLRGVYKETKKSLKTVQEENRALAEKVSNYESGEVVPEVLRQKDEEIVRLSRFEKLVNLKGSKEYREKYINPLNEKTTKLKEMFAEYGVPAEHLDHVVSKALTTTNRVDLNRFLQEHLGNDELGAIEAKELVVQAKAIQAKAIEAEKEPSQALEQLQSESAAVNQVRETERRQKITTTAQNSWLESLQDVRSEGKLTELIHKDNDPEFNKFYPDRILPQAAKEYGKIVTEMAKSGASELTPALGKALAKMVLLAHASSIAVETRNRAIEHADTLTTNLTRTHTMMRPPIGGGVPRGPGGGPAPTKVPTPEEEARSILNGVMAKR